MKVFLVLRSYVILLGKFTYTSFYHEKELLIPDQIGDNGYRYYSVEDITKLQHILFLRELDLTLSQIKDYFSKDTQFKMKCSVRITVISL